MKFLYFSDAHCKGKNPSSRTDNYYESWMIKFRELLSIAKSNKVDAIIDGGDLLDGPIVADSIVDDILDAIEETGIPFFVMWGNHPMIGHHKETSKGTSLAHMFRRCKLFQSFPTDGLCGEDFTIYGFDYYHNVEDFIKLNGINLIERIGKGSVVPQWKIAIVHAMLTEKPFRPDVLHVCINNIKSNCDLVLIAHWHQPWNKKVGKTQYLDIGAFGRTSIAEAKIEPSVLLIDTEKKNYEVLTLTEAKRGEDVFDLTKKAESEAVNADLDTFIDSLKEWKTQDLDLRGAIECIGKENNVDRAVIDIVLKKLGEIT